MRPQSIVERRNDERYPVDWRGAVLSGNGDMYLPCRILEWSRGGIRFAIDDPMLVATTFTLWIRPARFHACHLIWRDGEVIGCVFVVGGAAPSPSGSIE